MLDLSEVTVKCYVSSILSKLGVNSRRALSCLQPIADDNLPAGALAEGAGGRG